ncbi:MAG: hypothetical protein Q7S95_03445 [bacterium]|nr:hypothetical protein [bacterium]
MDNKDISIRQSVPSQERFTRQKDTHSDDIVLDKSIFSNVFRKDIRKAFIYKKAERLGNALYLITPAFHDSVSLRSRIEEIAVALVTAAADTQPSFRDRLSHELLALSSVISMARAGGLLSPMNADLIISETKAFLTDIAAYEEPLLALSESYTLAALAKRAPVAVGRSDSAPTPPRAPRHIKDKRSPNKGQSDRKESILSLIRAKGQASIKDISTIIVGVSEKTVQRELQSLIASGQVIRSGERRWSTYSLSLA